METCSHGEGAEITGTSVPLLLVAAAGVGIAHSVLPDHWVPLAVIARANRWSLARTAKLSFLASLGHVGVSLLLGVVLAAAGLALRNAIVAAEGQIVGGVLVLTGIGFLIWALATRGRGHTHTHLHVQDPVHADYAAHHDHGHAHHDDHGHDSRDHHHDHAHDDDHDHDHDHAVHGHDHGHEHQGTRRASWLSDIAVPFGVAASPDLTILPVFLAASAVGVGPAALALVVFALATIGTFVALTLAATIGGYQVEWPWLERNGHVVSALVLLVVGILVIVRL